MDAAAFSALSRELCSSSLSSHEKTTLFITEVASKEKKNLVRTTRDVFEEHLIRQLPLAMLHGNGDVHHRLGEKQRGFETVGEKVGVYRFRRGDRGGEEKERRSRWWEYTRKGERGREERIIEL